AMILKTLKERAETAIGQKVSKAVITVPAYFTDAQRQATKEAGAIAGLEVLRIINEPTAAALAYEDISSQDRKNIMVYDLGGGTFDVSIVKMEDGIVEVLASTGDNRLGGDDFDDCIVRFLADHVKEVHGRDVSSDRVAMARLKISAEKAKIALSDAVFVQIEEDHLGDGLHLSCELPRTGFEAMIETYLEKTIMSVTGALEDAGLRPGEIDSILLVGGSTRIPMVSKMLEETMGAAPSLAVDPDLCVALGAGIQAGREMGKSMRSVLIDITPYTFGTSAVGEIDGYLSEDCYVPMIRKNTKLPASRSEAFQTIADRQLKAIINVYQGENKNALDNIFIERYYFDLSQLPAGSVITLRYDLDLNGILKLEAVEKDTGRKINAVMENVFSSANPEQLDRSREKIDMLFGKKSQIDPKNVPEDDLPEKISQVLDLALEKFDTAPDEDRDEIINLMEDIKNRAREKDFDGAQELCDELDDLLFYID
ncbi:MAG: Hsp70 family protein, partial [Deltaproteobacteria bacterium]|nr:Hsp70 family protein [Deltaproteobacteria bacterium]